jgi:hypothetical protein
MTNDELNQMIRDQVELLIPTPLGGFENDDLLEEHKLKQDLLFLELCKIGWAFNASNYKFSR